MSCGVVSIWIIFYFYYSSLKKPKYFRLDRHFSCCECWTWFCWLGEMSTLKSGYVWPLGCNVQCAQCTPSSTSSLAEELLMKREEVLLFTGMTLTWILLLQMCLYILWQVLVPDSNVCWYDGLIENQTLKISKSRLNINFHLCSPSPQSSSTAAQTKGAILWWFRVLQPTEKTHPLHLWLSACGQWSHLAAVIELGWKGHLWFLWQTKDDAAALLVGTCALGRGRTFHFTPPTGPPKCSRPPAAAPDHDGALTEFSRFAEKIFLETSFCICPPTV